MLDNKKYREEVVSEAKQQGRKTEKMIRKLVHAYILKDKRKKKQKEKKKWKRLKRKNNR